MECSPVLFSIVIPYYDRLCYLDRTLSALTDQDIHRGQFEVIISCFEYSEPLLALLGGLPEDLNVRCAMSRTPWNVSQARNLGLRQAVGEVVILLDCDMLVPPSFLRVLRDRYFAGQTQHALVGQMLDYDAYSEVTDVSLQDYEYYRDVLLTGAARSGRRPDVRWTMGRHIPWALCWTALMAIPRSLLEKYSLYFDPTFLGWGAEDLEWGFRVHRASIPITFGDDVWGIHLPHQRDIAKNVAQENRNLTTFLKKWPCAEVELVCAFGALGANRRYEDLLRRWHELCPEAAQIGTLEFRVAAGTALALGAALDSQGQLLKCEGLPELQTMVPWRWLPLWGLRLPYESGSIQCAYLLPTLQRAPEEIRTLIGEELHRVSRTVLSVSATHAGEDPNSQPLCSASPAW